MTDRPIGPSNQERQMWPNGLSKYIEYLEGIEAEPSAHEALRAIACLPTGQADQVMEGQEQAYRAVEGLFVTAPMILCSEQEPTEDKPLEWEKFGEVVIPIFKRASPRPLEWKRIGSRLETATMIGMIYSVVEDQGIFSTTVAGMVLYRGDDNTAAKRFAQDDIATRLLAELSMH